MHDSYGTSEESGGLSSWSQYSQPTELRQEPMYLWLSHQKRCRHEHKNEGLIEAELLGT